MSTDLTTLLPGRPFSIFSPCHEKTVALQSGSSSRDMFPVFSRRKSLVGIQVLVDCIVTGHVGLADKIQSIANVKQLKFKQLRP